MARKVGGFTVGKGMRFSGETRRSFQNAAKAIGEAAKVMSAKIGPMAIRMIGEEIMTDVKASRPGHGVPRDTGALSRSGRVSPLRHSTATGKSSVVLSFGGPGTMYALKQHEITYYRHKVGEPRYLVRGFERWKPVGSPAMQAVAENARAGLAAVAARRKMKETARAAQKAAGVKPTV